MSGLTLETKQNQSLSQRIIQKAELLQMNIAQLDSFLENIFIENPLVDMDASYIDENCSSLNLVIESNLVSESNLIAESDNPIVPSAKIDPIVHYARQEAFSVRQQLYMQLLPCICTAQDQTVMQYLIDCLDDRGYLTISAEDLSTHFSISPDKAKLYLENLYRLEPAGIGARNLQECLLLQLARINHPQRDLAEQLVMHYLQYIAENRQKQLYKLVNAKESNLQRAIELIRSLNPIPLNGTDNAGKIIFIRPDILIDESGNGFAITLTKGSIHRLCVNQNYMDMLKTASNAEKEYIRTKYKNITWINHCLDSRENTLAQVSRIILAHQIDFFKDGPAKLIPYEQTTLAGQLNLNASTISRAIHEKYLQCRWGIFPLKYFFPKSSSVTSGVVTTNQVKARIQSLIEKEDKCHPLSDQKIVEILQKENFHLSRRTVAKYRAEMNIADTSHRRLP